jgi:hypothetical protein
VQAEPGSSQPVGKSLPSESLLSSRKAKYESEKSKVQNEATHHQGTAALLHHSAVDPALSLPQCRNYTFLYFKRKRGAMKTKGGREMNPTDAYRKQARKREIKRNRAERHYIREAFNKKTLAADLKAELEQLIAIEQTEELTKLQKLRKKVVQEAYENAIRKQKVRAQLQCTVVINRLAAWLGSSSRSSSSSSIKKHQPTPAAAMPMHTCSTHLQQMCYSAMSHSCRWSC